MQNSRGSTYTRDWNEISEYLILFQKPRDVFQCNPQCNLSHQIKMPKEFQMQTHRSEATRGREGWHPVFGEETLSSSRLPFLKAEMVFQDRTVASLRR